MAKQNVWWIVILVVGFFLPSSLSAEDFHSLLAKANQAWERKEYKKSQAMFARITNAIGDRAMVLFGPKFGRVYYAKGMTELKLGGAARHAGDDVEARKWFAMAAQSFRVCYEKFPNKKNGDAE